MRAWRCEECGEPWATGAQQCGRCGNRTRVPVASDAGPVGVCWEHQAGELPIRLSFTVKVF